MGQKNLTFNAGILGVESKLLLCVALAALSITGSVAEPMSADGAKNLFYKQIEQPSSNLNTGMQYWIELHRGGKVLNVSNKYSFRSGDKIRIHMKSNIDGFAYVMLLEGSRGEQSILFPDAQFHDNNKVQANRDIPIPADGYLAFDQNPGTEKVVLLLSRTQLDPKKYMADKVKTRVQIAAVPNGSKDLIPGSVVLAYADSTPLENSSPDEKKKQSDSTLVASNDTGVTTLVQKNPEEILAVDVDLMHQP